jgi:hypothetical protein
MEDADENREAVAPLALTCSEKLDEVVRTAGIERQDRVFTSAIGGGAGGVGESDLPAGEHSGGRKRGQRARAGALDAEIDPDVATRVSVYIDQHLSR